MNSLLTFILLLALLFQTLGCHTISGKKIPQKGDTIYTVSVQALTTEEIPDTLEIKGNFIPFDRLDVKSEVEGKINSVLVNEGQIVGPGDLLTSVNPEPLNLLLEKQKLELKEAEARFEAALPIKNPSPVREAPPTGEPDLAHPTEGELPSVAPEKMREATLKPFLDEIGENPPEPQTPSSNGEENGKSELVQRAYEVALDRIKAEIALTQKKIESAGITSGIGGLVTRREITEGSVVKPGEVLFQIIRIDPILLSVPVPPEAIAQLKKNDKLDIYVDDLPGQVLTGEITYLSPEPASQTKNYEIRISLANPQMKIKSGMAAKVLLPLNHLRKAIMAPVTALVNHDGKNHLYLVKDQMAQRKEVELGKKSGDRVEIKKGLQESDLIIIKGQADLTGEQEFVKVEGF